MDGTTVGFFICITCNKFIDRASFQLVLAMVVGWSYLGKISIHCLGSVYIGLSMPKMRKSCCQFVWCHNWRYFLTIILYLPLNVQPLIFAFAKPGFMYCLLVFAFCAAKVAHSFIADLARATNVHMLHLDSSLTLSFQLKPFRPSHLGFLCFRLTSFLFFFRFSRRFCVEQPRSRNNEHATSATA